MPLVVASFRSPGEARTALSALQNAGIEAMLVPQPGEFLGVVTAEVDADRAVDLLGQLWPDAPEERPLIEIERCRECRSGDILRIRRLPFFILFSTVMLAAGYAAGQIDLFSLLIVIVGGVLVIGPNRRCLTCGARWRDWSSAPPSPPRPEVEPPDVVCPRCGSAETGPIDRRRMKALTMLVNFVIPPLLFVWPFLPKRKCDSCGLEWR